MRSLLLVLLAGCSGTDFTAIMEGGTDGSDGSATEGGIATVSISCGPQITCTSAQTCCVGQTGGTNPFACADGMCPGQIALKCAKTADCAMGSVCCVHFGNNQTTSACVASCPTGPDDAQLCDPLANPSGCPNGVMCLRDNVGDWRLPQVFATCGGKKR